MKDSEGKAPVLSSLVVLVIDLLAYTIFLGYTLVVRRPLRHIAESVNPRRLSLPQELFLLTPSSVYVAAFLLFLVGLIVKEFALERRGITLRINLLALVGLGVLVAIYILAVREPTLLLERKLQTR